MIDDSGPRLLEYNVRFGDPECQVLMPRLMSDLLPALIAARDGVLKNFDLRWYDDAALTVVMASKGYPGAYDKGSEIRGLDEAAGLDGVTIFHAGTANDDEAIVATRDLSDPSVIACKLVTESLFTRWQAAELISGRIQLKIGKYRLRDQTGFTGCSRRRDSRDHRSQRRRENHVGLPVGRGTAARFRSNPLSGKRHHPDAGPPAPSSGNRTVFPDHQHYP